MNKITITLTRYRESNDLINPCLKMLAKQKKIKAEIYFLDQKYDKNTKKLCKNISSKNIKFLYKVIPDKSLSYARNEGIKLAKTDIILFIDCDAIPMKDWAFELAKIFKIDNKIAVVGGKSIPKWIKNPSWYHKSNIAMDVYSLIDISNKVTPTEKIVGVNFAINKKHLGNEAMFNVNLGRRPGSLLGGEETDFCRRILKKGFKIYYTPYAVVKHQIQKDRMTLYWLIKRFYYGGLGKAMIGGAPKTYSSKRNIYDIFLMAIIIVPYVIGYLKGRIKNGF